MLAQPTRHAQDQGDHPSQGSTIAKGLDSFAPCGPLLTLKRDVPERQHASPALQRQPGNRLLLGAHDALAGGHHRHRVPAPVVQLRAGDLVELTIGNLGTLRNRVVANDRK